MIRRIAAAVGFVLASLSPASAAGTRPKSSWRSYVNRPLSARSAADCVRRAPAQVGGTQGYSDSLNSGRCYVSIHPVSAPGLIYRDYLFFDDGLLMVFSSYGEGNEAHLTSAREFYFFPRSHALELALDPAALTVSVRNSDGARVVFDPHNAQIASVDRGAVTVSPRIDPAERGGVEFPSYAGLMLDAGFRIGESPSGRPEADSVFRSAQGQLCAVKNREVFLYTPDGEHDFKFTDVQLADWLQTRCPGLHVGHLK